MSISGQETNATQLAWLDTIGADTLATIAAAPQETIVPELDATTGDERALRTLAAIGDGQRLVVGDVIGEGGMGVVRRAEQVALGRTVAVKALKPGARDPRAQLDLLREAWITGSLEHPNVVPVHALELAPDGAPTIVMKRIEGVEWSELIGDAAEVARRFGATDLLAWNLGILERVLDAVRYAHHVGIIHRDLKPANVMIGDFGEVYLLDWGIAVSLRDDGSGRFPLAANARHLAGTPAYMAPEMLGRDEGPPLSERTDVYLAGAVLFEIVTGAPPHRGSNAVAMLAHVIASRPELPSHVPAELAKLITRAMHPEPDERFESADALRRALRHYLEHRGSEVVCARAIERLGELRAAVAAARAGDAADEIYRLFGACRSGFHDALATWKDNARAIDGLDDALLVVAEYELERGRAQAAVARLRERSAPTPLLARAHAEVEREARRIAELERVGRQHDVAIGRRTRMLLTVVFGTLFTVIPSIIASVPALRGATHATHIVFAAAFVVVLTGTMWWARESLLATSINRTVGAAAIVLFVIQGTIAAGDWLAGRPPTDAYRENLVLYAAIVGMLAITLDRYLAIGAVGYLAAYLLVSNDAALALYMASVANAVFTALAVWRWTRL